MGAMLACLVRAIQGPRYEERLVALNLICTVVVLMVCILSYLLEASYLVDVAILVRAAESAGGGGAQPHLGPLTGRRGEEHDSAEFRGGVSAGPWRCWWW